MKNVCTMDPLQNTFIWYQKHLLGGKQCNGTLKRKDTSFLNDATLFVFICHPARCFLYHVTILSKGPIRDSMGTSHLVQRALDGHIRETCVGNLTLQKSQSESNTEASIQERVYD